MRSAAAIHGVLIVLLAAAGCRNARSDLVEAELRTKERMLRETKDELDRARLINEALERDFIQRQQGQSPDANSALLSPKDIVLANGTGGVDDDRVPGDEALQVVVVPRDEDGHPVRAVGVLSIAAWEIVPGGVKVPLSTWEVNAHDLRRTWKSGLLGSGYHVVVPWKKLPTQNRLRVAVQLQLTDGRTYEADKDISIRPLKTPTLPPDKIPLIPDPGPSLPCPAIILPPRPASE